MFTPASDICPSIKRFLLFAVLVYNTDAFGQIKISGKVVNSAGHPMGYASVELFKDSTAVQAVLTDSAGVYQMSVQSGRYYPNCRYAGSLQKGQAVDIVRDTVINIVFVKQVTLEEVVVSSKKPLIERKIDRYIFNVENSIVSTGSDALAALSKTPGVRINHNQISLVGKSAVSVLIDDRLLQLSSDDLSNYLKSIPSDNIQKIEVITNPPSKYEAQGNSGLINIVMKKTNRQGYYGSVRSAYAQTAYYPLSSGGGNFNYKAKKTSFYANASAVYGHAGPVETETIHYAQQTWVTEDKRKDNNKSLNGKAGIEHEINKNIKAGLSYASGIGDFGISENITTAIYNNQSQTDSTLTTRSVPDRKKISQDLNFYAEFLLDTLMKKITLDGSWFDSEDSHRRDFFNKRFYANGEAIPQSDTHNVSASDPRISLYVLKADARLPFKKFTFSAGGKIYFLRNNSHATLHKIQHGISRLDRGNSDQFIYHENVQAIYADVEKKAKAWEFKIGLRVENTQAGGQSIAARETNKYDYFRFFPTSFISYQANEKNTFSVSYGRRIERPTYWALNPFRWYLNPYSYVEGNAFLQPSFSHHAEISHTYNGALTTAFSFGYLRDGFSQVTLLEKGSRIQPTKTLNFLTEYSCQLMNTLTCNPVKWIETAIQTQVYDILSKSALPQTRPALRGWTGYVSADHQLAINKKKTLIGILNFWYQSPAVSGNDNQRSIYSADAGVKSLLLGKNLQLSLTWTDVFRTNIYRYDSYINDIRQEFHAYYDDRRVKFTIVYNFGKSQFSRQERSAGNEEEKERAK